MKANALPHAYSESEYIPASVYLSDIHPLEQPSHVLTYQSEKLQEGKSIGQEEPTH